MEGSDQKHDAYSKNPAEKGKMDSEVYTKLIGSAHPTFPTVGSEDMHVHLLYYARFLTHILRELRTGVSSLILNIEDGGVIPIVGP